MSVYQRDGRYMVYYKENGKRRDKSFGRGDEVRIKAEAFDLAVHQANEQGTSLPVESPGQQNQSEEESGEASEEPAPALRRVKDRGGGITFGELSKLYLNHLRVQECLCVGNVLQMLDRFRGDQADEFGKFFLANPGFLPRFGCVVLTATDTEDGPG